MDINLAHFNTEIGRQKPENIIHSDVACPFCETDKLTDIIAADGDIILLKNKYNVIEEADQFVLIEGHDCNADMPSYTRDHMHRLIAFGMDHWAQMRASGKYETVLFFKNYGPYSGGTIRHPHMQLVGFPSFRQELAFRRAEFEGLTVAEQDGVTLNLSTAPRVGFWELNIVPADAGSVRTIADYIQIAVDFFMNAFRRPLTSYNIFFYNEGDEIFIKIMPRFATSPVFIGYNIRLLPSNLVEMRDRMRATYFEHDSKWSNL
ncbi:DUF4931 domain-containing protein [Selenomonas timonae]|uniref:DUF4931 domain-containing protein n=1 Tax=Selenomonas timonae TaxID=2754044 RepID=A0A7G7VHW7_9FIRM|nr:DUF4931 domain-containing protein [Selenomonas timonae]QNH53710.1 DUF4931 domain-containing protein [Selenomonas timonae]